jgi:hypothetical protein
VVLQVDRAPVRLGAALEAALQPAAIVHVYALGRERGVNSRMTCVPYIASR